MVDWSKKYYQYTNRLAHLYFLRKWNNIDAYLIMVYFFNDEEMNGPSSIEEWRDAIDWIKRNLGIIPNRLDTYILEAFVMSELE